MTGTVTISDQRSYIKIETLRGKNPKEIHGALCEVCGVFTVDRSTVSRWDNCFRGGCVSIDNDPRRGRLRTSTEERSVKLVADALEEDRRATCEGLSKVTGAKTSQENAQELSSVACGWATHSPWQCSPEHRDYGWEVLPRAPYSTDQSPPDFDLFLKLKEPMRVRGSNPSVVDGLFQSRGHTLRSKLYVAKIPQKSTVL